MYIRQEDIIIDMLQMIVFQIGIHRFGVNINNVKKFVQTYKIIESAGINNLYVIGITGSYNKNVLVFNLHKN